MERLQRTARPEAVEKVVKLLTQRDQQRTEQLDNSVLECLAREGYYVDAAWDVAQKQDFFNILPPAAARIVWSIIHPGDTEELNVNDGAHGSSARGPCNNDGAHGGSSSRTGRHDFAGPDGSAPDYCPPTQPLEGGNKAYNSQSVEHNQEHGHRHRPPLQFDKLLCEGSEGLVYQGSYNGTKAVIKLLGPKRSAPSAFRKEVAVYEALTPMQGNLIPRLLSTGRNNSWVWHIAVSFVEGTPLSKMGVISQEVAQAAMSALDTLHSEGSKGFLHGDVRLENIICLEGSNKCCIIDFGRSKTGASQVQQTAEKRQLAALVGLAG